MKLTYLTLLLFIISACSTKGSYESIQSGKKHECTMLPKSQYDECIENANKPYDEYERERQRVTNS